jgi:hypothetical protein
MKRIAWLIAIMISLVFAANIVMAESAEFRTSNPRYENGKFYLDLEIRDGDSPRTLSSLTVDVNYGPELKEWTDGDIATDWAFGFMNGYSIDSRAIGDDSYRLMAIAPNVKPGVTEGWDVKDSWQKIATLRWNIAKATSVEISIDDGTNTAAYFENHQNNPEGNVIGWSVSNYDLGQTPLPIELSSFDATYDCDGCVVLNWTTQTEFNNAGFHVYRSTDKDGGYNLLNEKLVESTGNYTYKYIDDTVDTNVDTYYYYLEDVDLDGVKSRSQIIKVTQSFHTIASLFKD